MMTTELQLGAREDAGGEIRVVLVVEQSRRREDLRFPPSLCRATASASGTRLRVCLHLAQPRNITKEGGDSVSPLKSVAINLIFL